MNDSERLGPDAVKQAIEDHRDAMHAVCAKILGDGDEAAEVTNQAVANALRTPPPAGCANTRAWLCTVARNASRDFLRRKGTARKYLVPLETEVDCALPDQFLASDLGPRLGELVARAREFLDEGRRAQVDRYLRAELGQRAEAMSAEDETVIRAELGDALVAVWLVDSPGEASNRCDKPARIAAGRTRSPELLKEITAHVAKCAICRRKRKDPTGLLAMALATLGIVLAAGMSVGRKVGVVLTTAAAAVAVTMAVVAQRPHAAPLEAETRWPVPVSPSQPPVPPGQPLPQPQQPPPAPAQAPPPAEEPAQQEPAAPPPPAEPAEAESVSVDRVGRDDSPPDISGGRLDREEIASGACPDQPTTAKVRAVVTSSSGVAAVTVHLRGSGEDMEFQLTKGDRAWRGSIGPVPGEDMRGRFDVVIRAVGVNGQENEQSIGSIRITCCNDGHH